MGTGFQFNPTKKDWVLLEQVLKPSLPCHTIDSVSLLPSHSWAPRGSAMHIFLVTQHLKCRHGWNGWTNLRKIKTVEIAGYWKLVSLTVFQNSFVVCEVWFTRVYLLDKRLRFCNLQVISSLNLSDAYFHGAQGSGIEKKMYILTTCELDNRDCSFFDDICLALKGLRHSMCCF